LLNIKNPKSKIQNKFMAKQELNYNKAFAELEKIVLQMENEEVQIDELAQKVKRASELIKFCKEKLYNSELEITKVMKEISNDNK